MRNVFNSIGLQVVKVFFSTILIGISFQSRGQLDCPAKTRNYIIQLKTSLKDFIPDPGNDEERDQYLQMLRQKSPEKYDEVERLSIKANREMQRDTLWQLCFQQEFLNVNPTLQDENIIRWSAHLFKRFIRFELLSPEFEKGFGIHIGASQGAADLGLDSEAYSFSARALMAYTFSRNASAGRIRALAGVSTYYFDNKFFWFANPRIEYRIIDIGNELTTFGNVKALVDANFGKTWIAGLGVAVELHNFGVELMYQRQGEIKKSHLLVGIFYRFLK